MNRSFIPPGLFLWFPIVAMMNYSAVAFAQSASPVRIDFGTVISGSYLPKRVTVTNTGEVAIRPQSTLRPCQYDVCARFETRWTTHWSPGDEGWVKPGDSCVYEIAPWMSYSGVRREAAVPVTFLDVDGVAVHTQVEVMANTRFNTVAFPDRVDLGVVGAGATAEASITVTHYADDTWKILRVRDDSDELDTAFQEIQRDGETVKYLITVRLSENRRCGEISEYLTVETNDIQLTEFRLYVHGRITPALRKPIVKMSPPAKGVIRALVILQTETPMTIRDIESLQHPDRIAYDYLNSGPGDRKRHLVHASIPDDGDYGDLTDAILVKFSRRREPVKVDLSFPLR